MISSGFSISFTFSDSDYFYSIADANSSSLVTFGTLSNINDTPELNSETDSLAALEDDYFDFIYLIF